MSATATLQPRMLGEDFAGVAAIFAADPFRQALTELATSAVPVLAALPAATAKRCVMSVFGFDAPYNDREAALLPRPPAAAARRRRRKATRDRRGAVYLR